MLLKCIVGKIECRINIKKWEFWNSKNKNRDTENMSGAAARTGKLNEK